MGPLLRPPQTLRALSTATEPSADAVHSPVPAAAPIDEATHAAHRHRRNVLRPYQLECIEASLGAFKSGVRRTAVSMPVGSGKTASQSPEPRTWSHGI
ncbi:putative ATP-dependent helicase IRC3 [Polyrhizophydium stewartii]|uniref:ATP-dependent helicase IRC3 n=1 Tax=Polyrhizophydium stewartii TaxID=2732419 RepID=A0ABR4N8A1_9FUNG